MTTRAFLTEFDPRKDTTAPHPLFTGNVAQYSEDQEWRKDIPKARAGSLNARNAA